MLAACALPLLASLPGCAETPPTPATGMVLTPPPAHPSPDPPPARPIIVEDTGVGGMDGGVEAGIPGDVGGPMRGPGF